MDDPEDSEDEYFDALLKLSESKLNWTGTSEKIIEYKKNIEYIQKKKTSRSNRPITLSPGNSISCAKKSRMRNCLSDFLKIICGSILDNRYTSFFRNLTPVSQITSTTVTTPNADINYSDSKIGEVSNSEIERISNKQESQKQVSSKPEPTQILEELISNERQLIVNGIDFSFCDFENLNSLKNGISIEKTFTERTSNAQSAEVKEILDDNSDNLIDINEHHPRITEIHSKNLTYSSENFHFSCNKKDQYSQTSGNYKEEESHERSDFRNTFATLENIKQVVFVDNEKLEKDFPFHSNEIKTSKNFSAADCPNHYYHKNIHAMRLDCQKDNEELRVKPTDRASEKKKEHDQIIQFKNLLEIYASHKINQEWNSSNLQHELVSDISQDELSVEIDPKLRVEMLRKPKKKFMNKSEKFFYTSSLSQNLCKSTNSRKNSGKGKHQASSSKKFHIKECVSSDEEFSKGTCNLGYDGRGGKNSVKKRKKRLPTYCNETISGEIKRKHKSRDKCRSKECRTTKFSRLNKVLTNLSKI